MKTSVVPRTGITACTDPQSSRYALGAVLVNPTSQPDEVWLSASDGRCFAAAKATGTTIAPDLIPLKAFQGGKTREEARRVIFRENGHWVDRKRAMHDPVEGRFPRCPDILPGHVCPEFVVNTPEGKRAHDVRLPLIALHFDASILARLAHAVNSGEFQGVTLLVRPDGDGCVDHPIAVLGDAGFGVLMPLANDRKARDAAISQYRTLADDYRKHFALPGTTPSEVKPAVLETPASPVTKPEAEPEAETNADPVPSPLSKEIVDADQRAALLARLAAAIAGCESAAVA